MNCNPKQAVLQQHLLSFLQHVDYQQHTKVAQISKFLTKSDGVSEF
jgi:hypothetical protein